jgi:hypothetical protein
MTALASLTESGFLQYDFNAGQVNPHLNISVSAAQIALFPLLQRAPQGPKIINLYFTTDFTPPVATFISNMQAGITATVDANASVMATINSQISNWAEFEQAYNSYG